MADVTIGVKVDSSNAQKNISDLEKSSTRSFERIAIAITGVNQALELISKARAALAAPINAAVAYESALKQLQVALAITGQTSQKTLQGFEEFASQIQRSTGVADELVLSASGLLASLTSLDSQGLKKATSAAVDLSAALGISLDQAASLVAKSIEGNTGALSRYGIKVKEAKTETERYANTISALQRFNGAAEKQSLTFAGSIAKLTAAFEDVLKQVGFFITQNQLVIGIINAVASALLFIASAIEKLRKLLTEGLQAAFLATLKTVEDLVRTISSIPAIDKVLGASSALSAIEKYRKEAEASANAAKTERDNRVKSLDKIQQGLDEVKKGLENFGTRQLATIEEERKRRVAAVNEAVQAGLIGGRDASDLLADIQKDNDKKVHDVRKKLQDELEARQREQLKGLKDVLDVVAKTLASISNVAITIKGVEDFKASIQDTVDAFATSLKKSQQEQLSAVAREREEKLSAAAEAVKKEQADKVKAAQESLALQRSNDEKAAVLEYQQGKITLEQLNKIKADLENTTNQKQAQAKIDIESQTEKLIQEKRLAIAEEYQKKENELRLKLEEEYQKQVNEKRAELDAELEKKRKDAALKTIADSNKFFADSLGQLADVFLPGLGAAIGGILNSLTQAPEQIGLAVKAILSNIGEFIKSIGVGIANLVTGIIDAVPAFITGLVDGAVGFIQAITDKAPEIITKLAEGAPTFIQSLAERLQDPAFLENLGKVFANLGISIAEGFGNSIIAQFENFINAILKVVKKITFGAISVEPIQLPRIELPRFATEADKKQQEAERKKAEISGISPDEKAAQNKIIDEINAANASNPFFAKIPRLATGGDIPDGFPRDSFFAGLSSGETVVPSPTVEKLNKFLDGGDSRPLTVNLVVGESELAQVVLNLNRKGFRLA